MKEKERKNKIIILITSLLIFLVLIGATYAYFKAQIDEENQTNINIQAGTTDSLTFFKEKDIYINATLANFAKDMPSITEKTSVTAKLVPNDANGTASATYNVFFIIDVNDFVYTTSTLEPELLMKVTKPDGTIITNIEKLKNVSGGFDITTRKGGYKLGTETITTSDGKSKEETWKVEVTLVNLPTDQNDNGGKTFHGSIYITGEDMDYYDPPEINVVNITEKTYTNVKVNVTATPGSGEIGNYYYSIKETDESQLKIINSIYQEMQLEFVEETQPNHEFTNLEPNKNYKIYVYTKNSDGYQSNIKEIVVSTDNYNSPTIDNVDIETTPKSIMVTINATAHQEGTMITNYYYQIDNDDWIGPLNEKTYTFKENIVANSEHIIKVKVEDSNNYPSTEWTSEKVVATDMYNVYVVVQNGKSIPSSAKVREGGSKTFKITADSDFDLNNAMATPNENCEIIKGILTIKNVSEEITCNVSIPELPQTNFANYIVSKVNSNVGDGELLHHDLTLEDGANDNSYRYSGNNPNNFVCFGPGAEEYDGTADSCPLENLYRIIGVFDGKVKLIKSEYGTHEQLGEEHDNSRASAGGLNFKLKRVENIFNVDGISWDKNNKNIWSESTIYKSLNNKNENNPGKGFIQYLDKNYDNDLDIGTKWSEKIASVTWYVDGIDNNDYTPKEMFDFEIGVNRSPNATTINDKIGLMYVSDYGFATAKDYWTITLPDYYEENDVLSNNWLFNAIYEWTISRDSSDISAIYFIHYDGDVVPISDSKATNFAYRPVFYLDTKINMVINDADGSINKPFRIV